MARLLLSRRAAVSVVFGVTGATFATWATRLPEVVDRLGLSEGQVGIGLFGLALGALLGLPVAGVLAGRWGSGPVTRVGLAAYCGALVAIPLAPDLVWLTGVLGVFGAGNSGVDVGMSLEGVEIERSHRRPIMGSFSALFSLGGLAGGAVGTAAAGARIDPLVHFGGAAVVLLVVGGMATRPFQRATPSRGRRLLAVPTRGVVLLGLIAFCGFLLEGVIQDWGALYLRRVTGASPAWAAGGLTGFLLAMAAGRLASDRLVAAVGPARAVRAGAVISLVGLVMVVGVPRTLVAAVGLGLLGLGISAVAPVVFSLAGHQAGVSPSEAVAAVSTIGYGAFLAGPALMGGMAELLGLRAAIGILALFSLALFALGRGVPHRHPLLSGD